MEIDVEKLSNERTNTAMRLLRERGIEAAWRSIGAETRLVGSCATGLLCRRRDIDLHVYTERLDAPASFRAVSMIRGVRRLEFRNLAGTDEDCLEWHAVMEFEGEEWTLDMIHIRRGSRYDGFFERVAERIRTSMTPEARRAILRLKFEAPEEERIPGIVFCQAVLSGGVRTSREFAEWRRMHSFEGVSEWMP